MTATNVAANVVAPRPERNVLDRAAVRIAALVLLLTAAAVYESFRITAFLNDNIWWHLRAGLWILQEHAFPRYGLFSQYADSAWVACSWGFDVLLAALYKLLGLRAIPALLMGFKVALAAVTFLLARGRRGGFWCAILLSAIAQYVMVDLLLSPMLFSILFFGIELLLLLQSREHNDARPLFWLPLLFFFWANLDEQFLNGLLLLGVFLAAEGVEFLLHISGASAFPAPKHSLAKIGAVAGLSAAATLVTPYGFRLYPSAFQTAYSKVLFENFQEMHPMAFRRPQHFVLLLLVMGAFFALGRRRSRDLFKIGVLGILALLAFRVQRDVWCVVLPSIVVIADAVRRSAGYDVGDQKAEGRTPKSSLEWKWEKLLTAVLVLAVFQAAIVRIPNTDVLMSQVSRPLPVKACDFIRADRLPGPLFNAYSWGGFLIWYLPEYPVAMDGRLNLYGDEDAERYFKVTEGKERLETEPRFVAANTILLEPKSGLMKALTTLPVLKAQFRVAYQDDVAAVLVRQ